MRQMIQKSSLIIIPTTIFLIFAAKPLFLTLFGDKWLASVPYFQLICIANLLNIVYLINNYALNSVGKSKLSLKVEIIKRCLILISVLLCFNFGVMELMIGYAISCLISWFISLLQVNKTIGLKISDQLKDVAPIMIWSIIICYLGYLFGLFTDNIYYKLIIQGTVSLGLYIGVISIFYRELWNSVIKFLKMKK
jgi:O-antigen/teichoic acid export membrane protein